MKFLIHRCFTWTVVSGALLALSWMAQTVHQTEFPSSPNFAAPLAKRNAAPAPLHAVNTWSGVHRITASASTPRF